MGDTAASGEAASDVARRWTYRAAIVGGCFGLLGLEAFRWWQRWLDQQECNTGFDCLYRDLLPLLGVVAVLLAAAFWALVALRVGWQALIVLLAAPLNGLAAVATHAWEPRPAVVVLVSAASWALAALVAAPSKTDPSPTEPELPEAAGR